MNQDMSCVIRALPVRCGDCFFISFSGSASNELYYILVDTGYANTYSRTLKPIIEQLVSQSQGVDLFVLTHTDGDHIGGIRPLLADFGTDFFEQVWFNYAPMPYTFSDSSGEISIKKGIPIRNKLMEDEKLKEQPIVAGYKQTIGNALLTVLSPDEAQFGRLIEEWRKEEPLHIHEEPVSVTSSDYHLTITNLINNTHESDTSWSNRSSIAFILEIGRSKALFTSDAHPEVLITSLLSQGYTPEIPIPLKFMQVSHHGSKGNTTDELVSLIDCQHYLISTNASNKHHFPHKEALSRIIWATYNRHPTEHIHLYFTYNDCILIDMFSPEEKQRFNLICHYPDNNTEGISIKYIY